MEQLQVKEENILVHLAIVRLDHVLFYPIFHDSDVAYHKSVADIGIIFFFAIINHLLD